MAGDEQGQERSKAQDAVIAGLRGDFARDIGAFLKAAGISADTPLRFRPEAPEAEPAFIITGASFTPYDPALHGDDSAHALHEAQGARYLMNNTAALLVRLMDEGRRVIVHSGAPDIVGEIVAGHPNANRVRVVGGDLGGPQVLHDIYAALESMSAEKPVSTVRMALYQSFAQASGEPFKPLHNETVAEVERAASRRLRFVYNMAAMGYDFLVNRNLDRLRVVSLSALAANRATYGLLADAADKFMNELVWRTFHLEANISTGKPVTIYQVNPGITAACDVYRRESVRRTVYRESVADGFPLDDDVLTDQAPLPRLSARDVAWAVHALLTTQDGEDPNRDMPESVAALLYGGFTPEELRERFRQAIKVKDDTIAVDPDRVFPEHVLTPGTQYGALPQELRPGEYKRISLCPPGQRF